MSVVPAPFGFGIWTAHVTPTLLGVPTVVAPRFDAAEALALIERHRVTVLAAVSTQFIMMLNAPAIERHDLSSLRVLFTGGEAVPYERAAEFEERTGACVLQFYGSNETGAVSGTSLRDTRERRLRSAGRVIPEMKVRLFDEAGRDVTSSGRGQPACKGPTLSRGYFGDDPSVTEANEALIRDDGWMLLGDLVTIDDEGYLEVIGRTDDFIIRGGKNISARSVEEQVATHPDVALAAAVAMPDPVFGERVCVYVELRPGRAELTLDSLVAHLRERNASKETLPERLVLLDELPRASGGKVTKQWLRDDIRRRLESE
jgi:acyl-CoA synthetase